MSVLLLKSIISAGTFRLRRSKFSEKEGANWNRWGLMIFYTIDFHSLLDVITVTDVMLKRRCYTGNFCCLRA